MLDPLEPNRESFKADPFGYASLAALRWKMISEMNGSGEDSEDPLSMDDLNQPVLWLCQGQAMTVAATTLLQSDPDFSSWTDILRGILHSQFYAAALMLLGYSLEISCKAVVVLESGSSCLPKQHRHHRVRELAAPLGDFSEKEKAILELLSEHSYWAGRYPSPAQAVDQHQIILNLSNQHEISAKDLLDTASRVQTLCGQRIGEIIGPVASRMTP